MMAFNAKARQTMPGKTKVPARQGRLLAFICAMLALVLVGGCASPVKQGTDGDPPVSQPAESTVPQSYDEVYDAIESIHAKQAEVQGRGFANSGGAEILSLESVTESDVPASDSASSSSYSETNIQVAGIDEGDIVKTDGSYLYSVAGSDVVIIKAAEASTEEVARVSLSGKTLQKQLGGDSPIYPQELYIQGKMLLVVYQYSPDSLFADAGVSSDSAYALPYYYRSVTEVACFDVSTPDDPRYLKTFGQDGYLSSSRLQDGVLYLISNFTISSGSGISRDDPGTFVPLLYEGDDGRAMEVADMCLLPDFNAVTYTIVSSIDVEEGKRIDQMSLLGSNDTTYMSYENLYLAGSSFQEIEENSYKDGSFQVTEYRQTYSTRITRLPLDGGTISLGADAMIEGGLLNQFSLDEYEGHLRAVTTVNTTRYRTLDDGKGEIYDYGTYESEPSTNALYVLDEDLHISGSIVGLAEDERVYSVRFDGPAGYFVTFRETDPLFAVDLADPENPEIRSALKIPGFSSYLHVYGEGRLFGLGMSADMKGRTEGLKVSMFDTADPYNVTEKHTLGLEEHYSEALYDHKAILVAPEKDLIGFPADGTYLVFGYTDQDGFIFRADLAREDSTTYYSSQRGIYIGDCFYLCRAESVDVYDLKTFDPIKQVDIKIPEPDYVGIMPLSGSGSSSGSAGAVE